METDSLDQVWGVHRRDVRDLFSPQVLMGSDRSGYDHLHGILQLVDRPEPLSLTLEIPWEERVALFAHRHWWECWSQRRTWTSGRGC